MTACRGNMLVVRRVDLVSCVVVGCGRISDNGVCPCEVLSGLGLRFFCAGWLLVAEICLFSGAFAWFCARWWGAAESPIMGLSLWSAFGLGFAFFSRGMAACRGNMLVFRRVDFVSRVAVGCGRISESGVCPCGVLSGLGLRFFLRGMAACLGNMLGFR
jgi:hypothetical protein